MVLQSSLESEKASSLKTYGTCHRNKDKLNYLRTDFSGSYYTVLLLSAGDEKYII